MHLDFAYYIKVSGIPSGNKLKKMIRYPHIWRYDILTCGDVISSYVKISMISLISSLFLKLYLNLLVYHQNIFGSSSKVFGSLWKSSDIFGNFWKFSENVWERSSGLRNNFGKSSEIFGKWSEIFWKSSISMFTLYLIKRTLHVSSKVLILCSHGKSNISRVNCTHSWDIVLATRT